MNKTAIGLSGALVVSLLGNAWQVSHRAEKNSAVDENAGTASKVSREAREFVGSTPARTGGSRANSSAGADSVAPGSLEKLLAISDPMDRYEAILAFVRGLPIDQIPETLDSIRESGGKKLDAEGRLLTELLLTRWGAEDPEAAFASLEGLGVKEGARDALRILTGLASADPGRAAEWLGRDGNRMTEQPSMAQLLAATIGREWSRRDPDAALGWATGLPDGQRRDALAAVLGSVIVTDSERALAMANRLSAEDRNSIVGELAGEWARRSPEAALSWIETLGGSHRSEALAEVIESWATSEPAQAASYVNGLSVEERSNFVADIGRQWSRQDPVEAAQWLGSQPESSERAEAAGHLMWNWASNDPQAAADWLGQLPAGQSYDTGVAGFAKAAVHAFDDAESGVLWAATIENEQLRGTMVNHTLGQWMRQDREAAQTWATENGVEVPHGK